MNSAFSDEPINGSASAPDLLDRGSFVKHVVNLLEVVAKESSSSVLGLIGPWGSGKSSILAMIERELLSGSMPWCVGHFNPWLYSDANALQTGFFSELREALPNDRQWSDAREKIGRLAKVLAPSAGLIPTVDVQGALTVAATFIEGDQSATTKMARAAEKLDALDRPVLMLIDDLDRLEPNELLTTLKLVRLVGRLPNVFYLLGYDERTLLDVLLRSDLFQGSDTSRASAYMEKIVQMRLDMPPLRETQIDELVERAILTIESKAAFDESNWTRFQTAYSSCLRRRLATPRGVARYFAQVRSSFATLDTEVDFVDFLLITWIRTAEPGVYSGLPSFRSDLTEPEFLNLNRKSPTEFAEYREEWLSRLGDWKADEAECGAVLSILELLFPNALRSGGGESRERIMERKGIGHPDYFDRYFAFGIPAEDISDGLVRAAMSYLAEETPAAAVDRLRDQLENDTGRSCRKIRVEQARSKSPVVPLWAMLAEVYTGFEATNHLSDPSREIEWLATDLVAYLRPEDSGKLIERIGQVPQRLYLIALAVARHNDKDSDSGPVDPVDPALMQAIVDQIRGLFEAHTEGIQSLPHATQRLIWPWRWIEPDGPREWFALQSARPGWSTLEVLTSLVNPDRMDDSFGSPALDLDTVRAIVGVQRVVDDLLDVIDETDDSAPADRTPTWENRKALALWKLKRERQQMINELGINVDPEG